MGGQSGMVGPECTGATVWCCTILPPALPHGLCLHLLLGGIYPQGLPPFKPHLFFQRHQYHPEGTISLTLDPHKEEAPLCVHKVALDFPPWGSTQHLWPLRDHLLDLQMCISSSANLGIDSRVPCHKLSPRLTLGSWHYHTCT